MIPSDTPLTQHPVLVLFGPTASGKTGILLELINSANGVKAEVISADSMQVYRGMDIGTAKPSVQERFRLPHHLIDICDPCEQFNAGDFVRLADEACIQITGRGKLPVVSGGTGFYLKNFVMGLSGAPPSNEKIRMQLKQELKEKGAAALMEELAANDTVSAKRIHTNDVYRLLRALEVFRSCGRPLSSFETSAFKRRECFRFIIIGLSRPREELYQRINLRCAQMFSQGLADEIRTLYKAGYTPNNPGLRAIGYREFFIENIEKPGEWQLSKDIKGVQALIAQNSRRYAKRQITFFDGICETGKEQAAADNDSASAVKWIEPGNDDVKTAAFIRQELETFL